MLVVGGVGGRGRRSGRGGGRRRGGRPGGGGGGPAREERDDGKVTLGEAELRHKRLVDVVAKFAAVVAARRDHDAVDRRARVLAGADDGSQRKIGGGAAEVLANRRAPQPGRLVVGPHDGHAAQPKVADVHLEARPAADGVARVAIDRVDGREAVDEHVLRRRAPRGERLRQPALARAKLDVHRRRRVDEAEAANRVDDRLVLHRVLLRLEAAGAVVRHARDAHAVAAHSVVERRVRAFDAADQREQLLARDDAELRRSRRRFQRVVDRAARDGRGARRLRRGGGGGRGGAGVDVARKARERLLLARLARLRALFEVAREVALEDGVRRVERARYPLASLRVVGVAAARQVVRAKLEAADLCKVAVPRFARQPERARGRAVACRP